MLIANTKEQDLTEHCVTVGKVALELFKSLDFNFNAIEIGSPYVDEKQLAQAIQMGAQDGDLGKALLANQRYFQSLLSKNEGYEPDTGESSGEFIQNNPLHHEISYILAAQKAQQFTSHLAKEAYLYAVYWHHAKPLRDKDNLWNEIWLRISNEKDAIDHFLSSDSLLSSDFDLKNIESETIKTAFDNKTGLVFKHLLDWSKINELRKSSNPKKEAFRIVQETFHANTINTISRLMAIISDRTVSKLTADELSNVYNGSKPIESLLVSKSYPYIKKAIEAYLEADGVDLERSQRQEIAAMQLAVYDSNVCSGAPGVGKTRIALSAYAKRQPDDAGKRLIWVCPRIDVCLNVLDELSKNLPSLTIQIHTGNHQYSYRAGKVTQGLGDYDIKVTTIDQVCNKLLKHARADEMLDYLQSSIVFDEFHEMLTDSTFIPYLYELIWLKAFQSDRDLTLISGTVAPMHLSLMGNFFGSGIVECPTFNQADFSFNYINNPKLNEEMFAAVKGNWIVFQNKVLGVQKAQLKQLSENRNDGLIYHSKYNAQDREFLFEQINKCFGKRALDSNYTLLNAGPAAKASLNISRANLMAECTDPETQAQQMGRENRFGEAASSDSIYLLGETRYDKTTQLWKVKDSTLASKNQEHLAFYFNQFMRFTLHGTTQKLQSYYDAYDRFYNIWKGADGKEVKFILSAALTAWTMENVCKSHDVFIEFSVLRQMAMDAVKVSMQQNSKEKTAALQEVVNNASVPDNKKLKLALLKFITYPNSALEIFKKAMSNDFIGFLENVADKMVKQYFEPTKLLINSSEHIISKLNLRGNAVYANSVKSIWVQGDSGWNDSDEYIGDIGSKKTLFTLSPLHAEEHIGQHIQRLRKVNPGEFKKLKNQAKYGKRDAGIEKIVLWNAENPTGAIYASILKSESPNTFEPVNYMIADTCTGSIPIGYFDYNKLLTWEQL